MTSKIPQLDGLRATAVLVVMVGHIIGYSGAASLSVLSEVASLGVDLFFVLSGFLITGILIRSKGSEGYYSKFFGRRALRIWPLYYLFLLFLYVFGVLIEVRDWNFHGYHFGWYVIYAQALRYPVSIGPDPISITWSLAIEEQFYLLWPFVVAFAGLANLRRISWGIVLAAPLFRALYLHFGATPYIAFVCRADAIAFGSLVAIWVAQGDSRKQIRSDSAYVGLAIFAIFTGICIFTPFRQVLAHSLTSAFFTLALILTLSGGWLARVLSVWPFRYIGSTSYCLYLVHLPVIMILRHYVQSKVSFALLSFALAIVIAELSRRYFEGPILSLKDRWFESHDQSDAASRPSPIKTIPSSDDRTSFT